jgi:beta-galactosidase
MPGCWLKEGENEIIVLDISGPEKNIMNGRRNPILDMLRVKESPLHKEEGQVLNLMKEKPINTGTFKEEHNWQKISFNKEIEARYLCVEMLNSYGKDDFASIAELEVLDKHGNYISRQDWKIIYASSEEVVRANNSADKIYDLQESTFWHTRYSTGVDKYPHHIVIDFGKDITITGFAYLPRVDTDKKGLIKDYRIYAKKSPFQIDSK